MSLYMAKFWFWQWLGGFVYLAEGLVRIIGFGRAPAWTTHYNAWLFLND